MPEKAPFILYSFNDRASFHEALKEAITIPGIRHAEKIEEKQQFRYLKSYLYNEEDGLNVKTIVVEEEYTSLPFLADYINYYADCYSDYQKKCRRVHFFKEEFYEDDFKEMVTGTKKDIHEKRWKSYAGYIVIKPLPSGFIGSTVLEQYGKPNERQYAAIKDYPVNVYGRQLYIRTLEYQEQDGIVGCCASASLGFAFHKTNELFGTLMPSPSEITMLAGVDAHHTGKSFPNKELSVSQICRAIAATGLISEVEVGSERISDQSWFNACVHAYLRAGIPVLLGIRLENNDVLHLITLNGYRSDENAPPLKKGAILLNMISNHIIKFYAHDDQLGPFSRLTIIDDPEIPYQFDTSYWVSPDQNEKLRAASETLIIPLKETIRVYFNDIMFQAVVLDAILKKSIEKGDKVLGELNYVWDVYLVKSNNYKKDIKDRIEAGQVDPENSDVLFKSLPQYIWVIRAYVNEKGKNFLLFDVLFDAVDVNYLGNPYFAQFFNTSFKEILIESEVIYDLGVFNIILDNENKKQISLFDILAGYKNVIRYMEARDKEISENDGPASEKSEKEYNKGLDKTIVVQSDTVTQLTDPNT